MSRPTTHRDVERICDAILESVGSRVTLGLPLGIGKANHIANELVQRALNDEIEHLEIFTALSLNPPEPASGLERRLTEPILERLYGEYPGLDYVALRQAGELPDNIVVREFYYPPGSLVGNAHAQRQHKSVNYTHALREILGAGVDVIAQLVAPGEAREGESRRVDLGGNTDLSLDIFEEVQRRRAAGEDAPLLVAQVNRQLPGLGGPAEVEVDIFDLILDDASYDFPPFGLPRRSPDLAEYAIGIRASTLLKDGGTLQVGIGSIGMALCWASRLRHLDNDAYRTLVDELGVDPDADTLVREEGGLGVFDTGLYASTEMFVEGLLHLLECGVVDREVVEDLETQRRINAGEVEPDDTRDGVAIHGGFFLGSPDFYQHLRELPDAQRRRIHMTSVRFTNLLLGDEDLKRAQRHHARFCNEAMKVTLLGAVVSDGLESGRVVSGVGGQYEFVSMAHQLDEARSLIMLPATRESGGELESNIVWNYGHTTIPRHLRDIVVTEYGCADLRGKTDEEVVRAMIEITDARFHDRLVSEAKRADKLPQDYQVPGPATRNTPEYLEERLAPARDRGVIERTPFGSELTSLELDLAAGLRALGDLRDELRHGRLPEVELEDVLTTLSDAEELEPHLARMGLDDPSGAREQALRRLVIYGLAAADIC